MDMRMIRPSHDEWPKSISELPNGTAPNRLFAEGRPLDLGKGGIAVVGTRRPTVAGMETAREFARSLAESGFSVVSGLAVGIDATAHGAALEVRGRTVAVLGTGLDVEYPKQNLRLKERIAREGTLLTEFETGSPPDSWHFPLRNRIIAGLCEGVLVVEGGVKSGALITARLALDAGRTVWAVPGSRRNPVAVGPNLLIRSGEAALVTDPQQIFDELAPGVLWQDRPLGSGPPHLGETEKKVLQYVDEVPLAPDRIVAGIKLPAGEVSLAISQLEIRGLLRRAAGAYGLSESGIKAKWSLAAVTID